MLNRHPKGAKLGLESIGGRFAPKIYAHSRLELSDPFARDIQKAYDELLNPLTRGEYPIETDAQKVALELLESREQLRAPRYHAEITEEKGSVHSVVLDPALETQWGGLYDKLKLETRLKALDQAGIDVAGEVVIEMLSQAKKYREGEPDVKGSLPTLALAKKVVRADESKYFLLSRFNISIDEFKAIDGRNFAYLRALAEKQNDGLKGAELLDFAKRYIADQGPQRRPSSRIVKKSLSGLSEDDEADLENIAADDAPAPTRDYISEVGMDLEKLTPKQRTLLSWEVLSESLDMSGKVASPAEGVIDARRAKVIKAELSTTSAVLQGWEDISVGKKSVKAAAILSVCPSCTPSQAQNTLWMLKETGGGKYATHLTDSLIERAALPKGFLANALSKAQKAGGHISLEKLGKTSRRSISTATYQREENALSASSAGIFA